eukprot:TRINITY_DN2552_c0_g1_i1.p1 TRINITY_DN2552_c0_g1~~TRINITY_DN2552_c0_g1_i1.p1  ORF type:complete len:739 (-),score=232.55 TRINITY_DN2552_c0_g1_i1:1103-3319(-)
MERSQRIFGHILPNPVSTASKKDKIAPSEPLVLSDIDAESGVAILTLNSPPVNALSPSLITALVKAFEEQLGNPSVRGIVLKGRKKFCGGADIQMFSSFKQEEMDDFLRTIHRSLGNIEQARKPVVAAIDGFALGGGLELAMCCHARVATPTAVLGLPELNLGLIPGFGGTQRLPRLVGTQKAVEMMLSSQPVSAKEAKEIGLVDDVVIVDDLLTFCIDLAVNLSQKSPLSFKRALQLDNKIEKGAAVEILKKARQQTSKMAETVPHPTACLDAIEVGILNGPNAGLEREIEEFLGVVHTKTSKALIHLFFASKATHKVPGVTDRGIIPNKITDAAVIGGGTMGSGIATALLLSGIRTVLKEVNQKFLDAGVARIRDNIKRRMDAGKLNENQFNQAVSLLVPQLDYEGFNQLDLVVEAVLEDVPLKQKVFQELETHCNSHCILASNTSTINLDLVGQKTSSQKRIIGLHFFSPAHVMPLLEIVRTSSTSQQSIVDALELASKLKKIPIVVGNCAGFTVNRIFFPYLQVATFLVERGVSIERIDKALESFGFAVGPFKMADMSGVDVFAHVGEIISEAYRDRTYVSSLIRKLVKANRLGQKSGRGFYKYEGRRAVPDPEIADFVREARQDAQNPPEINISDNDIAQMLLYPVVNESCRVLGEGMVVRSADIDVGSIYGYNFPSFRGGIMKWGKHEGWSRIAYKLEAYEKKFNSPIFRPSEELKSLAAGKRLGDEGEILQ